MNRKEFFRMVSDRPTGELTIVQHAYWLAKNAHRPQVPRDNGERYFEHPRAVAISLIERQFRDTEVIVLALCHDVVEDTNTPPAIIVDMLGRRIWEGLELLSKYMPNFDPITGQILGRYKKDAEEYFEVLAHASGTVRLVKCADRLHNLSTCEAWEDERINRYIAETEKHIIPLARDISRVYGDELRKAIVDLKFGMTCSA